MYLTELDASLKWMQACALLFLCVSWNSSAPQQNVQACFSCFALSETLPLHEVTRGSNVLRDITLTLVSKCFPSLSAYTHDPKPNQQECHHTVTLWSLLFPSPSFNPFIAKILAILFLPFIPHEPAQVTTMPPLMHVCMVSMSSMCLHSKVSISLLFDL